MVFSCTIGHEVIDEYRHVHYKAYPGLFERAQDAFMEALGASFAEIEHRWGLFSVVSEMTLRYARPVLEGDCVEISTRITLQERGMTFHQEMRKDGKLTTIQFLGIVFVTKEGKSVPIPSDLHAILVKA